MRRVKAHLAAQEKKATATELTIVNMAQPKQKKAQTGPALPENFWNPDKVAKMGASRRRTLMTILEGPRLPLSKEQFPKGDFLTTYECGTRGYIQDFAKHCGCEVWSTTDKKKSTTLENTIILIGDAHHYNATIDSIEMYIVYQNIKFSGVPGDSDVVLTEGGEICGTLDRLRTYGNKPSQPIGDACADVEREGARGTEDDMRGDVEPEVSKMLALIGEDADKPMKKLIELSNRRDEVIANAEKMGEGEAAKQFFARLDAWNEFATANAHRRTADMLANIENAHGPTHATFAECGRAHTDVLYKDLERKGYDVIYVRTLDSRVGSEWSLDPRGDSEWWAKEED